MQRRTTMLISGHIPLVFSWEPTTTPDILILNDEQISTAFGDVIDDMTPCVLGRIAIADVVPPTKDTVTFTVEGVPSYKPVLLADDKMSFFLPIPADESVFCLSNLRLRISVIDRQSVEKKQLLRFILYIEVVVNDDNR